MSFFRRLIDFITLGSDRPILRLVAYYTALALVTAVAFHFFPIVNQLFTGERLKELSSQETPQLLKDGLKAGPSKDADQSQKDTDGSSKDGKDGKDGSKASQGKG